MESQNQEIVASGSPAEVPNDPGYGEREKTRMREVVTIHHVNGGHRLQSRNVPLHRPSTIDHTREERIDREGGREGGRAGERENERERKKESDCKRGRMYA